MKKSLFIFRQDLRTIDNRWFIKALNESDEILPIFVIDKNLVNDFLWIEDKKFWFLREALDKLSLDIKSLSNSDLKVFYDYPENIVPYLVKKYDIKKVYACKTYWDYWSKIRDPKLKNILNWLNIEFELINDYLLVEPDNIPQRKVFTPYYNLWKKVNKDLEILYPKNFKQIEITEIFKAKDFIKIEKHPYFTLSFWEKRFNNNIKENYTETRNDVDIDWTSKLSPYLRFWIYSVRQIYLKWEINESFISEIAWREFWQHINYYFPESKNIEFQENKRHIIWQKNDFLFSRFCEAKTGYPIIDASIKQLIETNWMHGRSRMIVASFLTKDLHIDWREWEKFFKKYLLDYDENINFWNWQWSASVWADPKPIRIFSPILQSEKFDKNATFIKKYIPELQDQDIKAIHNPLENKLNYISTIVDHRIEQKIARDMYKKNDLN